MDAPMALASTPRDAASTRRGAQEQIGASQARAQLAGGAGVAAGTDVAMEAAPSFGGRVGAQCGSTPALEASAPALAALPLDLIVRVLSHLGSARDLAAANAASRLFRGAPGECSPAERALRERARARGHERALLATLPTGACTWTDELLGRERVLELSAPHCCVVACSIGDNVDFSAFVDADGGLHTCGEEAGWDQDGLRPGFLPAAVAHGGDAAAPPVLLPTRVASLSAVRVVAVAAGEAHLLALSDAGMVYGCGDNGFGQLGLGDDETRRSFSLVVALRGEHAVGISAGGLFSLALTAAGCAYSWGSNYNGELGHGDTKKRREPTRIEALDGVRVAGVAAGNGHTLLLSIAGAVYSCGHGKCGQLGHGDKQDHPTPRRIEALAGVCALHVSAGNEHSLVMDADGAVRSFGSGSQHVLGLGHTRMQATPTPIKALASADVRAVRACAGRFSSAVLGADGRVHTFGSNWCAQLGLGDTSRVPTPNCVHALWPKRVVACSLGYAHSLYVTAEGAAYSCGLQTAALGHGDALPASAVVVSVPAEFMGNFSDVVGTAVATPAQIAQLPPLLNGGSVEQ